MRDPPVLPQVGLGLTGIHADNRNP